jgi:hypothetical protein
MGDAAVTEFKLSESSRPGPVQALAGARAASKLPGGDIFVDLLCQHQASLERDWHGVKSQVAYTVTT